MCAPRAHFGATPRARNASCVDRLLIVATQPVVTTGRRRGHAAPCCREVSHLVKVSAAVMSPLVWEVL